MEVFFILPKFGPLFFHTIRFPNPRQKMTLETSIEYVKGIGPERAKLIKNVLGLSTVEDMLNFYPIRYLDKSKIYKISQLHEETSQEIQFKGKLPKFRKFRPGKPRD